MGYIHEVEKEWESYHKSDPLAAWIDLLDSYLNLLKHNQRMVSMQRTKQEDESCE